MVKKFKCVKAGIVSMLNGPLGVFSFDMVEGDVVVCGGAPYRGNWMGKVERGGQELMHLGNPAVPVAVNVPERDAGEFWAKFEEIKN